MLTNQQFLATRSEGLRRLSEFLPKAGAEYASKRNFDLGPLKHIHVSCLSPYTRNRLISEQEIAKCVLAAHGFAASEKYISEVCWRTYWKGWLEHRPYVWTSYLADAAMIKSQQCYDDNLYQKALSAESGIECFDFWVKELQETGYLHNHARMWFASIWIHTLCLPWQLGAEFFLRYLIDGDPASNTLSWRWVAGLHTKGKSYLARSSNIAKYTDFRFSPKNGQLASSPLSFEQDAAIDQEIAFTSLPGHLPQKVKALVLWPDDLSVDCLEGMNLPSQVAMIDPQWESEGVETSNLVNSFRANAMQDTEARIMQVPGVELRILKSKDEFKAWLESSNINTLAWYRPFVGHGLTLSQHLQSEFKAIDLIELRRPWDQLFFPHAKKGFFSLKKSIPKVFRELNVNT